MKQVLPYGLILAFICTVSALALAGVNYLTRPKIIAQMEKEERQSLKELLPEAKEFALAKLKEDSLYKAYNRKGDFFAVVFKTKAKGYSSNIEILVAMTKEGKILAVKILSQNETPGLGTLIIEPEFRNQFINKWSFELDKIEAITGATISSKAVIDSVREKSVSIASLIKDEK
ncbi:MAG: RnfABCDGE type electron transport complex subunit G [Candidatus Omnitrophica bacterium]|nr:RnfABCDGE type electron transport complex subunit G [Candidatus Omnitrophota bacterium]